MQVEVVRHHRRAEDADGDEQHVGIARDLRVRHQRAQHAAQVGARQRQLDRERTGDAEDEQHHQHLDVAEAVLLQVEHQQHVERGEADAPEERDAEEQIQRNRRADDLREIARRDRHLAEQPQHERHRRREVIAARLRKVAAADDAEARRQRLQQDRHEVGQHDHADQRVAVARSTRQVGGPVAGIHVADRHEIAGAGKCHHLAPEACRGRHRHGTVDFRKADAALRQAPSARRLRTGRRVGGVGHFPLRYTSRNGFTE